MYDIHLFNNSYTSNKGLEFLPFAIIYRESDSIYMEIFTDQVDKMRHIPILLHFNSKRVEVFSIMRNFINLLKKQEYDIRQICTQNVINNEELKESEYRTFNLYNQDLFTHQYDVISLRQEDQQPILILDRTLLLENNKPYYIIPSREYDDWIEAFQMKPIFPLLTFGAQTSICKWTPNNHIHYPIEFRNRIYMIMRGVFSKDKENTCVLTKLNNDLLVKIIEYIVESTYKCPYYHIFKKSPLNTPQVGWGISNP
jgi:hypothetical protein